MVVIRGGNRSDCSTGLYGLAYIRPRSSQTFHEINQVNVILKAYLAKNDRLQAI